MSFHSEKDQTPPQTPVLRFASAGAFLHLFFYVFYSFFPSLLAARVIRKEPSKPLAIARINPHVVGEKQRHNRRYICCSSDIEEADQHTCNTRRDDGPGEKDLV